MEWLFPVLGLALIVAALTQMAWWAAAGWRYGRRERHRFAAEMTLLRNQIEEISRRRVNANPTPPNETRWTDFRPFHVTRVEKETDWAVSIWLQPVEPCQLPEYRPGQHLTLRFTIPGQARPVVRCYTLSDAPGGDQWRLTIKRTGVNEGLVSSFVNQGIAPGDTIDVKPPSGKFWLQPGDSPVVLLAGGIGITPMMSIMNYLARSGSSRKCLLVYGVRNGSDATFASTISGLTENHANLHVVKCFSQPLPTDRMNVDYHVAGRISMEVLRQALPSADFDFYLCGPPPFMESLYKGLRGWGVPDSRIRYEAFGPATIQANATTGDSGKGNSSQSVITLRRSGRELKWSGDHESILDWCESHGVAMDSGCRAGSCGSCETRLLAGQVRYLDESVECNPGCILPCVAVPDGPIEIDV